MIDCAPQVTGLPVDLHKDLIQVPLPLRDLAHVARSADTDLTGEHWPETVHPKPHAFMTDVDSTLMEEVFDIPKRERKTNVHHDRELDNLGRRFEVPEWIAGHLVKLAKTAERLNRPVPLTTPTCLLLN